MPIKKVAKAYAEVHTLPTRKGLEKTKAAQVPLGYAEGFKEDLTRVGKKYNGRKSLRGEL